MARREGDGTGVNLAHIGAWRSLVARSAGGRKVASSNLAARLDEDRPHDLGKGRRVLLAQSGEALEAAGLRE